MILSHFFPVLGNHCKVISSIGYVYSPQGPFMDHSLFYTDELFSVRLFVRKAITVYLHEQGQEII